MRNAMVTARIAASATRGATGKITSSTAASFQLDRIILQCWGYGWRCLSVGLGVRAIACILRIPIALSMTQAFVATPAYTNTLGEVQVHHLEHHVVPVKGQLLMYYWCTAWLPSLHYYDIIRHLIQDAISRVRYTTR